MKIGITGTRFGMSESQRIAVKSFLEISSKTELHHGDCVGVDVEVAIMAKELGYKIICHPPKKDDLRAFHAADEFREPTGHFARNRKIVNECDVLLVLPLQAEHQPTGGTWYTHDYAKKQGKEVLLFLGEKT